MIRADRLRAKARICTSRPARDEAGAGLPDTLTDPGDVSFHEYEEQVDHALAGNEEQLMREVAAALDRVTKGTFGRCGVCGQPIGPARLRAVPYAHRCINCEQREEGSDR